MGLSPRLLQPPQSREAILPDRTFRLVRAIQHPARRAASPIQAGMAVIHAGTADVLRPCLPGGALHSSLRAASDLRGSGSRAGCAVIPPLGRGRLTPETGSPAKRRPRDVRTGWGRRCAALFLARGPAPPIENLFSKKVPTGDEPIAALPRPISKADRRRQKSQSQPETKTRFKSDTLKIFSDFSEPVSNSKRQPNTNTIRHSEHDDEKDFCGDGFRSGSVRGNGCNGR